MGWAEKSRLKPTADDVELSSIRTIVKLIQEEYVSLRTFFPSSFLQKTFAMHKKYCRTKRKNPGGHKKNTYVSLWTFFSIFTSTSR